MTLLVFLGASFAAAAVGGYVTAPAIDTWYAQLEKPVFNPPNWVFGPVWTVLYAAMAVAAWLVWKRTGWREGALPLSLFGVQLVLNVGWSVVFFGLQRPGLALVEIVVLWGAILATALAFRRVRVSAFWWMVPYLAWTTFAVLLNASTWWLNS